MGSRAARVNHFPSEAEYGLMLSLQNSSRGRETKSREPEIERPPSSPENSTGTEERTVMAEG